MCLVVKYRFMYKLRNKTSIQYSKRNFRVTSYNKCLTLIQPKKRLILHLKLYLSAHARFFHKFEK